MLEKPLEASEGQNVFNAMREIECRTVKTAALIEKGNFYACRTVPSFMAGR